MLGRVQTQMPGHYNEKGLGRTHNDGGKMMARQNGCADYDDDGDDNFGEHDGADAGDGGDDDNDDGS